MKKIIALPLLLFTFSCYSQSNFTQVADSLYAAMQEYADKEDYDSAIIAQKGFLNLLQTYKQHESYVFQLSYLALLYERNKQYENALSTYSELIKGTKEIWGEIEFLAQMYAGQAIALIANKQYNEAKIAYKNADSIYQSIQIEDYYSYLDILYSIRSDLQFASQYNEDELHIAAKEAATAKKVHGIFSIHYARVLADIGNSFILTGKHDLGYPYLKEAYDFYEVRQLELPKEFIEIVSDFAQYHISIGNYEKALNYLLKEQSLIKDYYGENNIENAKIYNRLGKLYFETGEFYKAEENMVLAIKTIENTKQTNNKSYISYLYNLGGLYYKLGDNKKALNYLIRADEALEKINPDNSEFDIAKIKEGLGLLYIKYGRYNQAKTELHKAINIQQKLLGENNPQLASIYANLGQAYYNANNVDSAVWSLKESIKILETVFQPNQYRYEKVLNHKKNVYYFNNQFDSVAIMAEKSLQLIKNTVGEKHTDYRDALYAVSRAYSKINHPKTTEYIRLTISEDKRQLRSKLSFLSGDELLEFISKQLYETTHLLVYQTNKTPNTSGELFNHLLLLKGASLRYSNTVLSSIKSSKDTSLLNTYQKLSNLKATLAKIYSNTNSKEGILSLEVEADELEKQLVKNSAAFRDLDNLFATSWETIQKQLKKNEVAIEFVKYDTWFATDTDTTKYAALILSPYNKQPVFVPLFSEDQLTKVLSSISQKQLFKTRSNELLGEVQSSPANYGDSLYQIIWQPLEVHLKNTQTVYFSPDGMLHQVAFKALPTNDSTLLIDKYSLVQLLSLKEIKQQTAKKPLTSITIFGGITYDANNNEQISDSAYYLLPENRGTTSSFSYLQGTLNEATTIQELLKSSSAKVSLYSGKAGTEERFKLLNGTAPQILHLATHGFFIEDKSEGKTKGSFSENAFTVADNPLMRGGLILAGANRAWQGLPTQKGKEDGVLTAYEVAGMDLSNTELVVLSACQTGLGETKGTEGVFGLQRAFKMAGVDQLIMSLWSVPDKETQELMELFYSELIKTNNTRTAFETAQKTMRAKYAPYYWAAFVLVE